MVTAGAWRLSPSPARPTPQACDISDQPLAQALDCDWRKASGRAAGTQDALAARDGTRTILKAILWVQS